MAWLHIYLYALFGYRNCIKILITIVASYILHVDVVQTSTSNGFFSYKSSFGKNTLKDQILSPMIAIRSESSIISTSRLFQDGHQILSFL